MGGGWRCRRPRGWGQRRLGLGGVGLVGLKGARLIPTGVAGRGAGLLGGLLLLQIGLLLCGDGFRFGLPVGLFARLLGSLPVQLLHLFDLRLVLLLLALLRLPQGLFDGHLVLLDLLGSGLGEGERCGKEYERHPCKRVQHICQQV